MAKPLVRTARRMAERARIPWIVVNVQTPRHNSLPDEAKDLIAEALRLAESLGAEAVTLPAESDMAAEPLRSDKRRVGKRGVSPVRSRGVADAKQKNTNIS